MKQDNSAAKLKERLKDWQSYVAQPLSAQEEPPAPPPPAPAIVSSQPEAPVAEPVPPRMETPRQDPPVTALTVVNRPENRSPKENGAPEPPIEVLPPEPEPAPSRPHAAHRPAPASPVEASNTPLKDLLTEKAAAEYDYARKTNVVLSTFIVLLLAVISVIVAFALVPLSH